MKNQNIIIIGLISLTFILLGYYLNQSLSKPSQVSTQQNVNRQNCLGEDCLSVENLDYPAGELTTEAKKALDAAIDDEYHALSFYESVIAKFGQVRPFIMIKNSEQQHINALSGLYEKYGLKVPVNTWVGKLKASNTLKDSCQVGYEAEIKNASLYQDQLLAAVASYPDITQVFTNLMNASQQKHLLAFDRCN